MVDRKDVRAPASLMDGSCREWRSEIGKCCGRIEAAVVTVVLSFAVRRSGTPANLNGVGRSDATSRFHFFRRPSHMHKAARSRSGKNKAAQRDMRDSKVLSLHISLSLRLLATAWPCTNVKFTARCLRMDTLLRTEMVLDSQENVYV